MAGQHEHVANGLRLAWQRRRKIEAALLRISKLAGEHASFTSTPLQEKFWKEVADIGWEALGPLTVAQCDKIRELAEK